MDSTAHPQAPAGPLRFGPGGRFELQPAEYRLLVDGQVATLGGRALDLLMALAARPAQLLTKHELLDIVWPGLVVEENNLRVQINTLRRLLGEDAITTVPGRGYRLSVRLMPTPEAPDAAATGSPAAAPAGSLAAAATGGPSAPPAAGSGPSATPPSTGAAQPLVGRSHELACLEALLTQRGGCITLVGTPGVGKSSLARLALARWPGRSAWVDLAPLNDGGQVGGALARALGIALVDGDLATPLRRSLPTDSPLLLVLDNAEHLIDACAAWVTQLQAVPPLQCLVTSQLPLAVAGEQLLRLAPLPVADSAAATEPADGALALLMARISAADQRFQFNPTALPLLRALCRQLDGLPLALEMVAARVPLMGLQAVHDALAERFALLSRGRRDSPARHRSLRDALAWSYGLLDAPEQRLFRALGVFAGGFTLDLAVTLTADEHVGRWDVVDGLATLVERSLVSVNGEDPPRYRLLETLRAYALDRLAAPAPGEPDERPSLRRRHAAALLALFTGPQATTHGLAEMDNMREAFLWAREHDLAMAAQLSACATDETCFTLWRLEVAGWMRSLQPTMEGPAGRALPLLTQARWWSMLTFVLNVRRDPQALHAGRQAVALWRQLDNPDSLQAALGSWVRAITEAGPELDEACLALEQTLAPGTPTPRARLRVSGALAEAARVRRDPVALLACREQELAMAQALGWPAMAQAAESNICAALTALGRPAEAAERAQALLQGIDADDGDNNGNLPWALNVRVEALVLLGRFDEARALLPRSLTAARRFDTTVAWQGILLLVATQQQWDTAARLAGHVARLWNTRGASTDIDEQARLAQVTALVQRHLGPEAAAALAVQGQQLDDDSAAALVLGAASAPAPVA